MLSFILRRLLIIIPMALLVVTLTWGLIRLAQSSPANLSVVPLQDVLSLASEARPNTPSTPTGNYHWRYRPGSLRPELADKLAALAEVTDRLPESNQSHLDQPPTP